MKKITYLLLITLMFTFVACEKSLIGPKENNNTDNILIRARYYVGTQFVMEPVRTNAAKLESTIQTIIFNNAKSIVNFDVVYGKGSIKISEDQVMQMILKAYAHNLEFYEFHPEESNTARHFTHKGFAAYYQKLYLRVIFNPELINTILRQGQYNTSVN